MANYLLSKKFKLITKVELSMHLDCVFYAAIVHLRFPFFFIEKCISRGILFVSRSYALCTGPTTSLTNKIFTKICLLVGFLYCSRDPQTSFFNKIFIKNVSHGTIHIFKNYFATIFSVFNFQQNKRYPNRPLIT